MTGNPGLLTLNRFLQVLFMVPSETRLFFLRYDLMRRPVCQCGPMARTSIPRSCMIGICTSRIL